MPPACLLLCSMLLSVIGAGLSRLSRMSISPPRSGLRLYDHGAAPALHRTQRFQTFRRVPYPHPIQDRFACKDYSVLLSVIA